MVPVFNIFIIGFYRIAGDPRTPDTEKRTLLPAENEEINRETPSVIQPESADPLSKELISGMLPLYSIPKKNGKLSAL